MQRGGYLAGKFSAGQPITGADIVYPGPVPMLPQAHCGNLGPLFALFVVIAGLILSQEAVSISLMDQVFLHQAELCCRKELNGLPICMFHCLSSAILFSSCSTMG